MPKLSQHSLDKMHPCPHCDEFFRTRQGLSGHIQFKHKVKQSMLTGDSSRIDKWAKHLVSVMKSEELPQSRIDAQIRILYRWNEVREASDFFNAKPNNQDFRNYIITSLARMYENEEREERLINRINTLLIEHKMISKEKTSD